MLILAMESSAKAASAALVQDGALLAQAFSCSGLTHSRTLLPMAEQVLQTAGAKLADVDCLAVAQGPGSFTGIRIGVSAIKGLAWAAEKPAVGVATLEAMAYNGLAAGEGALVCCCMDARRAQIYNALFEIRGGSVSVSAAGCGISCALYSGAPEISGGTVRVRFDRVEHAPEDQGRFDVVPGHRHQR